LQPAVGTADKVLLDQTAIRINGDWSWLYAAIDLDSKPILDATAFGRWDTDPAAAFLRDLDEKHDLSNAVSLVVGYDHLTALARTGLSGQLEYTDRNHIEKRFHTLKMLIDGFHYSWVGGRPSVLR